MNIFKVLASGKKSFQEETASAILAWFMNPTMEHGLGYSFLSKFVDELSISTSNQDLLSDLAKKLTPRLRSEYETQLKLWCNLEYNVETAFIDIVIGSDDWIFAIENKIYAQSVSEGQLLREYEGLKKKNPDSRIGMIYLVPIEEESEIFDGKTEKIFEELSVKENDFKTIVTWQKNKINNVPSISEIISKILDDENIGIIDPVSEYTRHTLKALNSFISNDFAGYEYQHNTQSPSVNPLTEEQLSVDKLEDKNKGYVGVKGGIKGLLKMGERKIKSHKFQYTSQDMSDKRYWIEINTFKDIIKWIFYKEIKEIDWKGHLPSESLYKIAKDFKKKVFIGIRGGETALKNMEPDEIINKEWNISTEKANAQWIDGELFCKILDEKSAY
ncbi:MAG: PD-(D/E)XK nuclease family protein [Desulfobacteraceae bacterium]|nr:PD-(D/E)XK nuclease family protein [Desulfobacteraceae bacterium]